MFQLTILRRFMLHAEHAEENTKKPENTLKMGDELTKENFLNVNSEPKIDTNTSAENNTIKLINDDIIENIKSHTESGSTILDLFKNGPEMVQVTLICLKGIGANGAGLEDR